MALTTITAYDGNGCSMMADVTPATLSKVKAAEAAGADIIINTNWRFSGRRGRYQRVEKLAQTNWRYGGKPKHILWACYPGGGTPTSSESAF